MLDSYTNFPPSEYLQENWHEYPVAFLQKLLEYTFNSRKASNHTKEPHVRPICYYHEHNEELPRCFEESPNAEQPTKEMESAYGWPTWA